MSPVWSSLFALAGALGLAACGRPFDVKTAPGLIELDNQEPQYQYRAMAPEGVVIGVRVIDTAGRGNLEFWTRATTLRMRELNGYALIGEGEVKSRDGTAGHELRFGHDESGKPYLYTLRLYVAKKRLFLVEAGGPQLEMNRYKAALDWMESSLRLD
jgi:hypothetical protein